MFISKKELEQLRTAYTELRILQMRFEGLAKLLQFETYWHKTGGKIRKYDYFNRRHIEFHETECRLKIKLPDGELSCLKEGKDLGETSDFRFKKTEIIATKIKKEK